MSDDLQIDQFGKASVEAGQGYASMPPAPREIEEAQREKSAFDRGVERLSAIDQAGEQMPEPVQYNRQNADGTRSDERSAENLSVTPERAAADLSEYRRGQEEIQRTLKDLELADQIDTLRSEQTAQAPQQPQAPQPEAPAQEPLPPPQLPPELQSEANNELIAAFQREPKLLEAVNTLSWQTDQKIAASARQALEYGEALNQQYSQYTQANANIALAAMFSSFPELRGMTVEQINAATPIIERTNPERGAQIRAHVAQVSQLANEARQVQAAQAQQRQVMQQQQFQGWAQQQDNAFEAATKSDPPARQTAIRNEAHRMLREYGMSDQEINYNWQTNPMLRSQAAQMILRDAALYRMQQRTAQSIKPAPVPPVKVQTPGSRGTIATEDDADLRSISQRLNQSHSAKDAAALLSARRSRSR